MIKTKKGKADLPALIRLRVLISKMKKEEIDIGFSYLNAFDIAKPETKTSMLLRYVLENPEASAAIAAEYFGIKRMRTFEMLVNRLREKLAYVLTLDVNYLREGGYSPSSRAYYSMLDELKKIYTFTDTKNIDKEARHEISSAIKKGKAFEHYDLLVIVLYRKLNFEELRAGNKDHGDLIREIEHYEKCRDAVNKVKRWYNDYRKYDSVDGFRTGFKEKFKPIIEKLAKAHAETRSANVEYFYYIMKLGYLQEDRSYKLANEYALKILNLVRNNKAIWQRPRMGIAHMHISDTYLYQREFNKALEAAQAAQNYLTPRTWNFCQSEQLQFMAFFYTAQYERAEQIIISIIKNASYREAPLYDSRMTYFYACTLFAQGKIYKCAKVLNTIKEINSDKAGWNIGVRIMQILLSFSTGNEQDRIRAFEGLRKHIRNLKPYKHIRQRDLIIVKILGDLILKGRSFAQVYNMRYKEFILLESEDPEHGFQLKSHEMIIFHIWFKYMMIGRGYGMDLSLAKNQSLVAV